MSDNSRINELLLSDTSVSDIFIVQYMASLSKDAICLYMWMLMSNNTGEITESQLKDYSLLEADQAQKAVAELIQNGILIKKDTLYIMVDLKKKEVDAYCSARIAKGDIDAPAVLSSDEEQRNKLADSVSKTFYQGRMPYMFYRLIDTCLYEYKFEDAVVYRLFEDGRERKIHLKVNEMNNLASKWNDKGYNTLQKLGEYYKSHKNAKDIISLMGKLMRRRMNDLDIERINRWAAEYNATSELAEYAFKCNEFRGNIQMANVEDKLKEWHLADIHEIDKAAIYENERYQENKTKSSRKRGKNNTWKTGGEAGIKVEAIKEDVKAQQTEADDIDNDDILGLFRGVDD